MNGEQSRSPHSAPTMVPRSTGIASILPAIPPQGQWATPPTSWPDEIVAARETLDCIRAAIETLPAMQQRVITLRDIEGWSPDEICRVLGLTVANQRVLLHRARSRVRAAVERHLTS